jgi:hypothetical protein
MTPDAAWDLSAIAAIGVVVAAIVVRHVHKALSRTGPAACGGGCCGGNADATLKKPQGGCT